MNVTIITKVNDDDKAAGPSITVRTTSSPHVSVTSERHLKSSTASERRISALQVVGEDTAGNENVIVSVPFLENNPDDDAAMKDAAHRNTEIKSHTSTTDDSEVGLILPVHQHGGPPGPHYEPMPYQNKESKHKPIFVNHNNALIVSDVKI